MKVLALLALLALTGFLLMKRPAVPQEQQFVPNPMFEEYQEYQRYMAKYGKKYSDEEATMRFQLYQENKKKVEAHNLQFKNGEQEYEQGLNYFSDMSSQELQALLMTSIPGDFSGVAKEKYLPTENLNEEVDWRKQGHVQQVKNQGSCGSCWAFSVIGSLESAFSIKGRGMQNLAEQQLVDCASVSPYKCYGCSGCWPKDAFDYVKDKGVTTTAKYPYIARQQQCKVTSGEWKIAGYDQVPQGNVEQLKAFVNVEPVSVCVDASNWFSYRGGVFSNCGTQLNHAVLLVGYTDQYWIIKNSWGAGWGEQGYIRLARGNTCGVANHSFKPNPQ